MERAQRDIPAENVDVLFRNMQEVRETYTGDGRELHVTYAVDREGQLYGILENRTNLAGVRIVFECVDPNVKFPRALRLASAPDLIGHTQLSPRARRVLKGTLRKYNTFRQP
ncbi:MAG: hypothetical protein ABH864_05635 [archaeon]